MCRNHFLFAPHAQHSGHCVKHFLVMPSLVFVFALLISKPLSAFEVRATSCDPLGSKRDVWRVIILLTCYMLQPYSTEGPFLCHCDTEAASSPTSSSFSYIDRIYRHNAYDDTIVRSTTAPTPYLQHSASSVKLARMEV